MFENGVIAFVGFTSGMLVVLFFAIKGFLKAADENANPSVSFATPEFASTELKVASNRIYALLNKALSRVGSNDSETVDYLEEMKGNHVPELLSKYGEVGLYSPEFEAEILESFNAIFEKTEQVNREYQRKISKTVSRKAVFIETRSKGVR